MKPIRSITFALAVLLTSLSVAQQGINYKAVIKDGSGNVIPNDLIVVQFTILKGVGMSNEYLETHTPTTDANGIVILNIGTGTTSDDFTAIDWASDDHYLNVQINTGGGLVDMGTTGFKAVPYALHSKTAESLKSTCGLAIGDTHQGGIIFYLDATGCHGLIAAPTDQSTGIEWSNNGAYVDTYAYGNGIGSGEGNSQGIRRWQGTCTSCYASELCQDLSLGGYTDWYLPSKYELNLMYENIGFGDVLGLGNIGNFSFGNFYWSSTEVNTTNAWIQRFSSGAQLIVVKGNAFSVRAVRAF